MKPHRTIVPICTSCKSVRFSSGPQLGRFPTWGRVARIHLPVKPINHLFTFPTRALNPFDTAIHLSATTVSTSTTLSRKIKPTSKRYHKTEHFHPKIPESFLGRCTWCGSGKCSVTILDRGRIAISLMVSLTYTYICTSAITTEKAFVQFTASNHGN